jgi:hypothetical protein
MLKALGFKKPELFLAKWYQAVANTVKERLDKAASVKSTKSTSHSMNLSRVAEDIIKQIEFKNFPTDYIKDVDIKNILKVKSGSEIESGRDLTGNYVSIDKEKLYFDNKDIAKFVYYCAKRQIVEIPILKDLTTIKDTLTTFEKDLKEWGNVLKIQINEITDDSKYKKKLYELCCNKANYPGLI